ncbi:MAG TPA: nucleotide disphospho-sugar-binding domain-containing protein [Baekduia sp.]|nr:nucleotide disphospho-sugar-binding domain-containing protein [Baekduia sp.]
MSRFLFAALPADGHVSPMLPLARELTDRGHEVLWLTGRRYRDRVEAVGAAHLPFIDAPEIDASRLDEQFPGRADTKGLGRFRFDMREIFIASVPGQVADLERHVANAQPDVVVAEPSMAAAAKILEERCGIPWATFGIGPFAMPSRDTAPFGLGLQPSRTALGRARNRALGALMDRTLFRTVNADYRAMVDRLGTQASDGGLFATTLSPYLYLHPSVEAFEYPRSDLAPQVHFVGAHIPPAPPAAQLPEWWGEMLEDDRPVVLVTQGTIATDPSELVLPTIEALAGAPVQVIATTGGPDPADLPTPPANARIERYVPFGALMPHVAVYVTNGGYGGLHFALSHGVPLVVAGATEEKPELVARTTWSGAGIGLRRQRVPARRVGPAVRRVLDDPRYRRRAQAIQADLATGGGPAHSADLVERLCATRRPVLRGVDAPATGAGAPQLAGTGAELTRPRS